MTLFNNLKKILICFILLFNINAMDLENSNDDLKIIVKKILETDQKHKLLQAKVSTYAKGYYKAGKKLDKIVESRIFGSLTLKKPNMILFKVLDSDDKMAKGSTLLYSGGKNVTIRPSGIFSFMTINFEITNPMFTNSRGHKFSFDGLAGLRNPSTKVELIGTQEINNRKILMLKVISPVKADSEITHEIYKVDAESFIVLSIRMYVNNDMVSEYAISDINTNIVETKELFKL